MKFFYTSTLTLLFIFIFQSFSFATIRRVNNTPGSNADYSSFVAAQTAASPGDTIHLEPTTITYGGISVNKQLVIIGNGCFLDEHTPPLQANINHSLVSGIDLFTGSENSVITGLYITSNVTTRVSNIRIERNRINNITLYGTTSDIYILQNFINGDITSQGFGGLIGINSNIYIFNNIIRRNLVFQGDDTSIYVINNIIAATGAIGNDTFIYNAIIRNNIFHSSSSGWDLFHTSCKIENNLFREPGVIDITDPLYDTNKEDYEETDVFVLTGATDEYFQLLVGGANPNPALACGYYGGEDVGSFAVPNDTDFSAYAPYEIGCIPPIPSIYECTVTQNSGDLDVMISTRSNN